MRKKMILPVLLLILFSACGPSLEELQAAADLPVRILMIGSSLIENHGGMDTHVVGLANSKQPSLPVEGRIIDQGGAPLSSLWNNSITVKAIQEERWTVVVLQEIALRGSEFNGKYDRENFFAHVRLFDEEVQKSGAETILFMYWENPSMSIKEIAADHYEIASELGIKVAPVGLAWQKSLEQRPELGLHFRDNIHANIYGNYLAAAVVYATIFEESPEGLPYMPIDVYGDEKISPDDLAYLQTIAWETVAEHSPLSIR